MLKLIVLLLFNGWGFSAYGEPESDGSRDSVELKTPDSRSNDDSIRIAVGYFENTSDNVDLDMLRRGLAEMLITDLSVSKDIRLV